MWYFMAGMEGAKKYVSIPCDFGLMTFLGINNQKNFDELSQNINHILVDSGAYSFRVAKKNADFDSYVERYIEFVKNNTNNPKIVGFFELDIDSIIGYDKVLEYRKRLEEVSDKIIPVWHQNRGIQDYIDMCKKYSGKRVSVACVGWHDMYPEQLNLFINTAHKYNCTIHVLGMTHKELIRTLNLGLTDSFDSVGWMMKGAFANISIYYKEDMDYSIDVVRKLPDFVTTKLHAINYLCYRKIQDYYKNLDQSVEVK